MKGLTLGLAKTLAPHDIVVNGLAPGPTATPMLIKDGYDGIELDNIPSQRYTTSQEIANFAVVFSKSFKSYYNRRYCVYDGWSRKFNS